MPVLCEVDDHDDYTMYLECENRKSDVWENEVVGEEVHRLEKLPNANWRFPRYVVHRIVRLRLSECRYYYFY